MASRNGNGNAKGKAGVKRFADLPDNAVQPLSRKAWRGWLARNHGRDAGVWLVSYKKDTGLARFDYDAAVEEVLCFGWVDSEVNELDAARSMLWLAPGKPRTGWSRPDKLRIEKLVAAGAMTEAGLSKKAETRAARVEETARLAARGSGRLPRAATRDGS